MSKRKVTKTPQKPKPSSGAKKIDTILGTVDVPIRTKKPPRQR